MEFWEILLIIFGVILFVMLCVFIYANLPTSITLGNRTPTVEYLKEGKLRLTETGKHVLTNPAVPASEIFKDGPVLLVVVRRPGCVLCRREAGELSKLRTDLDARGVRLMGVVHETLGVEEFRPYLQGPIYYDEKKYFYGPNERWLPKWIGFLRVSTYLNGYKSHKAGYRGNMIGEGRLLGGVYLIDHDQFLYNHPERHWGDTANPNEILHAIQTMPTIQTVA
ncbi:Selenoprotein U [Aphelenchoides bicaudatus]|nr:Selenoprotein U [Aphelenchoides bicaudatus]